MVSNAWIEVIKKIDTRLRKGETKLVHVNPWITDYILEFFLEWDLSVINYINYPFALEKIKTAYTLNPNCNFQQYVLGFAEGNCLSNCRL